MRQTLWAILHSHSSFKHLPERPPLAAVIRAHLRCLLLALRWIPRLNLGDRVWHHGHQWTLIQGVCGPRWNISMVGGTTRLDYVHESRFSKVRSLPNYLGSFTSGLFFYYSSWFTIWVADFSAKRSEPAPWPRCS